MAISVETPPAPSGEASVNAEGLSSNDVRTRAVRGATMFVGRDVLIQVIGFATGLALARLLTPADFGITTLGLTIVGAANIIADGGIAASLITRKEPPTTAELRAVIGFQLTLTFAITLIVVPIGFALGGNGPATAIIMLSLPMYATRTQPMLDFERRLDFAPRIVIQVAELVTYGVVAIVLAVVGLGVWAMPVALVARAAAGTFYCYALSTTKWMLPSLRFGHVRPLLGFGVRFQMKSIVQLLRDVATVSLIGSLGGFQDLGYYGFCLRLLNIPTTVATALGEVTFPAYSRLVANGEDVGSLLQRTTLTSSVMNALAIAPLVAGSPALISFFFGQRWIDASLALPGLGISLVIGGPLGWNVINYLYATGDARTPLMIDGFLNAAATVVFAALGIKLFGLVGLGMGVALAQIVSTPPLLLRLQRRGGPNLWGALLAPVASAAAAIALGWWIASALDETLFAGLAALSAALAFQIAFLWVVYRTALTTCYRMIKRAAALALPPAFSARLARVAKKNRIRVGVGRSRSMDSNRVTALAQRVVLPRSPSYRRGRPVRYPRDPLRDRLRASIALGSARRGDFQSRKRQLRYAAGDFRHSVRNRGWLVRAACALGAIGLLFVLLSGSGSPAADPHALGANGTPDTAATSTTGSQSPVRATRAQQATATPRLQRGGASTAHRPRRTIAPVHHSLAVRTPVTPSSVSPPTTHTAPASPVSPTAPPKASTPTAPAPKHAASSSPKHTSPPSSPPDVNPCASTVGCGDGLIFGTGPTTLATAPAIGLGSYQSVATGATTLSKVIARFGAPLSTGALRTFIGTGAYAGLVGAQPSGDSCAYYLDSSLRTTRAFQLCFNGARELAAKAVISTSGGGSSGTS